MGLAFRLTFLLPPGLALVPAGRHRPCLHGCVLEIAPEGLAVVTGPSRRQVFAQAARFLKFIAKGHGPLTIAAVLTSPPPDSGRDGWTIVVGAEVAFAPTALGADVFPEPMVDPGRVGRALAVV